MARNRTIRINADAKSFSEAQVFIEGVLEKSHVSTAIASETMLLFEAFFNAIISQVGDEGAELKIGSVNGLGSTDIKITFSGKRFLMPEGDVSADPEAKIIETFSEKISCSYRGGDNVIRISVSKSSRSHILPNLIAVISAIVVSLVLVLVFDETQLNSFVTDWVAPLEKLFTNAVLMIGAPMTLFSLLKNVTDSFIVAERHSSPRKLFATSLSTSVVAIILAAIMGFVFARWILTAAGITESFDIGFANWSLASAVDQIIPSNILEPFQSISPVPMIVVALLIAAALCNIGQSFDVMKRAIDACYDLFSGILGIVMAVFPLACFLLFLEIMLAEDGFILFLVILFEVSIVFVCTVPLLVVYIVRLKVRGVHVREFVKKLRPLVKENLVIGSVIDAVPYNTRYCVKNFGFSRERLEKELPVLAQINLDGNCFILMLLAAIYIFIANCEVSWINVAVIGLIVLFLSLGAPNQPGSILIGMLIILTYLHSDSIISMALCFELFCGGLQNILNVISSVVTVAESESMGS